MSAEQPGSSDPSAAEYAPATLPANPDHNNANSGGSPHWRRLRLVALGGLTLLGSGVLCMGMLTGSAAWYTSRSQFCSSCHIMDPYYTSWQHSSHSEVACIKCHFAPGIGEKVRGKMLGLVQLCTYLTRSEGPRPVAEVSDASCLRSGCHEKRTLPGPLEFHGIIFDHGPHLTELEMGNDQHRHFASTAVAAEDALKQAGQDAAPKDDHHHSMTLRCTSCHGQQDPSEHIMVSTRTCFLCHFEQGHFNEGVGACTRCHQIPEERFDLGGGISFTHELVYENGVDCKSCHGDLNQGDGHVALVRCQVCHNREVDLAKIADGQLMHDVHVTEHKVDCMDCHEEITHALTPEKLVHAASDCASCHPDHHREQVNMLLGIGGISIPEQAASMSTSRVQCIACHREKQVSATGTVIWKASADVCSACHTAAAEPRLLEYQEQVHTTLGDLSAALQRARKALEIAELSIEDLNTLTQTADRLQHDLEFLNVGNGIHNIHYASSLTRALFEDTAQLCNRLNVEAPTAELPTTIDRVD